MSTTKSLSRNVIFIGSLTWLRTNLTYLEITENEVDRQFYPYSTSLVAGSLVWDRRGRYLQSDQGLFHELRGRVGLPAF